MSWKKTPEGFEAPGGIKLHQKGKKWYLQVDGKDHEIKSRRPSFDHAEGMLRDMGKKIAYNYDRTRTAAGNLKTNVYYNDLKAIFLKAVRGDMAQLLKKNGFKVSQGSWNELTVEGDGHAAKVSFSWASSEVLYITGQMDGKNVSSKMPVDRRNSEDLALDIITDVFKLW